MHIIKSYKTVSPNTNILIEQSFNLVAGEHTLIKQSY